MAKSARDFVDDEHDDLIKLTAAQYELSEEAASAIADILQDKCSVAVYPGCAARRTSFWCRLRSTGAQSRT